MQEKKLTEEQEKIWTLAALTAPIAHVASGIPWPGVLTAVLLSLGIRGLFSGCREPGRDILWLRKGIFLWAGAQGLEILRTCWPGQRETGWILGILLFLTAFTGRKGRNQAGQGAVLLWWAIAFLFGSVLLSTVSGLDPEKLDPRDLRPEGTPVGLLLGLLLLPESRQNTGKGRNGGWKLGLGALLFSVCSQGVLSGAVMQKEPAPFYTLSRSIAFYGLFQRMEALAWLGLMLGTYLYFGYLTEAVADRDRNPGLLPGILSAAGMGILYLTGAGRAVWTLTGAILLAGYVLPFLEHIFISKRK